MTLRASIARMTGAAPVNFALTNRLPRRWLTQMVGRLSKIENPWVARASIATWRFFADVDLSDATERNYRSMHACFTRSLRPGSRPADPDPAVWCSPSDGIVGACGAIDSDMVLQAKGHPYPLSELIGGSSDWLHGGHYVTLRLTSGMYHRFHAPHDAVVEQVRYFPGDCWNVNAPALDRVDRLYCRNERAVLRLTAGPDAQPMLLVPVAAILVAGIRLHFLDTPTLLRERGSAPVACNARLAKGEEMGWFEHGSTIIVLVPKGFTLAPGVATGTKLRAGQALFQRVDG
ncbi:archaetidylserine decarboxylase [Croceibacterium xixiisoli]|nr:archaetidylserine decarboxylase [Croceibacterium xixiisoli]